MLSIERWNYKGEDPEVTHIGPIAQEFHALFRVGSDDKTISTIDPAGIALAAIQTLYRDNQDLRAQIDKLQALVKELAERQ